MMVRSKRVRGAQVQAGQAMMQGAREASGVGPGWRTRANHCGRVLSVQVASKPGRFAQASEGIRVVGSQFGCPFLIDCGPCPVHEASMWDERSCCCFEAVGFSRVLVRVGGFSSRRTRRNPRRRLRVRSGKCFRSKRRAGRAVAAGRSPGPGHGARGARRTAPARSTPSGRRTGHSDTRGGPS